MRFLTLCFYCLLNPFSNAQNFELEPESTIHLDHITLSVRAKYDSSHKESILFLHGFPETSAMWCSSMNNLFELGYNCLAPDLRGYDEASIFKRKKRYAVDSIVNDILLLADHYGLQYVHLIGHDWGAAIGWRLIERAPERFKSWTALSIPHLDAFAWAMKNDPIQKKKSRYVKAFKTKGLAELFLRYRRLQSLKKNCWYNVSEPLRSDYIQTFTTKGILRASLSYYRENWQHLGSIGSSIASKKINIPTLFIVGKNDASVSQKAYSRPMKTYFTEHAYQQIVLQASHWLIQEEFDTIQSMIISHLQANRFADSR